MTDFAAMNRRRLLGTSLAALPLLGAGGLARNALAATDISYWHHFTSQTEAAGLARVMELFGKAYPDITVTPENIPNAEYMTKLTATLVAGSRPASGMVTATRFPDIYALGGLVDLSGKMADWPLKDAFSAAAFEPVTVDGGVYGIPCFSFINWMYYRTDYFEEAGLDGPPDTYEEFLEAAIKLSDPANNRYGFSMRGGDGGQNFLLDMIQAWGSPIVVDGQMAIDREKAIEAVRFYAELYTKHKVVPPSAPNDSYRQIMESFKTGQTAMVWHHTGSLTEIAAALPEGSFMTAIRPTGPAARIAQVDHAYNGVMDEALLDPAWDWVSFWGETDPAIAFLEETGYFPSSSEAAADPRIADNPIYAAAVATMEFGGPPPAFVGADGWARTIAFPAFQQVLTGDATPEEAVDTMMSGLERTLR
ncbi:MAG: extracellular solute-binding protein [Geminicoccaceae bacterium]